MYIRKKLRKIIHKWLNCEQKMSTKLIIFCSNVAPCKNNHTLGLHNFYFNLDPLSV